MCLVLLISMFLGPIQQVHAAPDRIKFTLHKGGTWTFKNLDMNYIEKNNINLRSAKIVSKVEFIPPDIVHIMALDMAQKVGIDLSKEALKYGLELAASSGVTFAMTKLKQHFGTSIASKLIPYLNAFVWSYVAYDIFSSTVTGQNLNRLITAAKNKTGLIHEKATRGGWDSSGWYYWDGSSRYGKYPAAYLHPNKYQIGITNIIR